ncbi:MAG: PDDEXK nuclease domain-containing protein [Nocardioidaceae bacterium]
MTSPRKRADLAVPDDYLQVLAQIKQQVHVARQQAFALANKELVSLNWSIGKTILERQQNAGWGARVIDRLSADLRAEFPGMTGFARSSLHNMRAVAAAYPDGIVQPLAGRLSWTHLVTLVEQLDDPEIRVWYAEATARNGWSKRVLLNQIKNRTHLRVGAAPSNFAATLPAPDSELAQEVTKDPYVFEFLDLVGRVSERELEDALVDQIQATLGELGRGFAFVGRQVPIVVGSRDHFIDLLFFHVERLAYVVVELKIGHFDPRDAGQLGFYVAWVDENLKIPDHRPTLGILMCADKSDDAVRYALRSSAQPMAVASYTYEDAYTADSLPEPVGDELPVLIDLVALLERAQSNVQSSDGGELPEDS